MLTTATPTTESSFPKFLADASAYNQRVLSGKSYAHDHGVDETALLRYANGAVSVYERREIEEVVARCAWALDWVVNYVKNKRETRQAA